MKDERHLLQCSKFLHKTNSPSWRRSHLGVVVGVHLGGGAVGALRGAALVAVQHRAGLHFVAHAEGVVQLVEHVGAGHVQPRPGGVQHQVRQVVPPAVLELRHQSPQAAEKIIFNE